MAELQTSYSNTIAKGYAGMVANGETSNRITRTCEDAGGIGFGVPVYRGSGDHGATATVGTLATFLGWTIAVAGQGLVSGQTADTFAQYDNMGILTGGAIYIAVKGAVADGDAITVGKGGGIADLYGATAADATHIATGFIADETVTDGICRIVKR
jgi:hypothetical protein